MKTILVTLVLFQLVEVKTIKVFDTSNEKYCCQWLDGGWKTSPERRAPSAGLQVILYLGAGTANKSCARLLRKGLSQ